MNINRFTRGKAIIQNKLIFAGGHPKFSFMPKIVRWGKNTSFYWLGTELVWLGGE